MIEVRYTSEALAKGLSHGFVICLLFPAKEVRHRRVCHVAPCFIAPEPRHTGEIGRVNILWIPPQHIPVHVGDRKVQEHIDSPELARGLDHAPVEMEAVGLQKHEAPTIVLVPQMRKNVPPEHFIAIALINSDFGAVCNLLSKRLCLLPIQVDEVIFPKWWGYVKHIERTARNHFTSCSGQMHTCASERIH